MTTNKDPLEYSKEYLVAALACALISGCFSLLLLLLGWGLSEFTNWILSLAGVSVKVLPGYTTALVMVPFVTVVLLHAPAQGREQSPATMVHHVVFSGIVSLGLIGFALFVRVLEIVGLPFTTLLVVTYFIFSYSETLPNFRESDPES